MKLLVLGVNGFIGSHLTRRVVAETDWEIYGMDLAADRLGDMVDHPRVHYIEGDISINKEWIEYHVKKCDVCLPLVAIATPASYVRDPLAVFELDFEENLRVVRQCARYGTRVIFPSTSEVYGMCPEPPFNEETSLLVYGPIHKQRWIYACAKQMMDRVIWAMGQHRGLRFTLIRPFNWIGAGLDTLATPKEGSSRVVTQFLGHLLREEPINLVDGGRQRRSFTYVDDGLDCLLAILRNEGGRCDGRIFNIGNPANDVSIRELAELMIDVLKEFPDLAPLAEKAELREVSAEAFYGKDYQDIGARVPDITAAREVLGWEPKIGLREALRRTIAAYVADWRAAREALDPAGGA
ncbi:bifunctional UDP-4-keto-pentose/UDP-xylose synthase [Dissulfurirhabdus thermomarina]|uniref:Bifunctional UDP-4-keto-pentose/UDP-xylose synthase n=1 Tax=Dissulfurirhabdus thermomarina TaxID=1765737 RepID=A0A6N9TTU4_DISTH|nr:bifunctional UDP-4-keto-pentose/UDP-xylose synthase [Dissulfurirhabdus thermomarina]NDY43154.1 bifunctional UDP-4-keto-pentose/UDP-xylose synthase [Dissulfurirhabdus thermomarina]NMX22901.1 bifunctional UDP-4-keto-pentose/UDP-xylose synthase [Dissulfurirhabdus thermomarina]